MHKLLSNANDRVELGDYRYISGVLIALKLNGHANFLEADTCRSQADGLIPGSRKQ